MHPKGESSMVMSGLDALSARWAFYFIDNTLANSFSTYLSS